MSGKVNRKPFIIFYLLFFYVIAFSLWWAMLLYNKNKQAYLEQVELQEMFYERNMPGIEFKESEAYKELSKKYRSQKIMIISEGLVFISILAFGLLKVRESFHKELALANQQRNFLLSITHELKSPLASIKLTLQTLFSRELRKEQSQKIINNALFDVDRLEGLVDNILFAARIENDNYGFATEEIPVSQLLLDLGEKYQGPNVTVQVEVEPGIYWEGDRTGLSSVLVNLIENAIKYSRGDAMICLAAKQDKQHVTIDIKDQGLGIPDDEKLKVFEKFYRIGNEDTRSTKGTGLGLFIVKRVIELHGGEISVLDNSPKGSVFRILLPVSRDTLPGKLKQSA